MTTERKIKARRLEHKPQPHEPMRGWVERGRPLDAETQRLVEEAHAQWDRRKP